MNDTNTAVGRACELAERVAGEARLEVHSRHAARLLYDATTAALAAIEGARLTASGKPDSRSRWARVILEQRLSASDPFAVPDHAVGAESLVD